jgi:glycosyltransferase involved in cell wall biosynthesis
MNVLEEKFTEVANRCGFLIFPSCSEGQAGGVLDSMALGLIPIITRETGINTADFGVTLPDAEIGTIQRIAREMSELDPELCQTMGLNAYQTVRRQYTPENFRARVNEIFDQVLPT